MKRAVGRGPLLEGPLVFFKMGCGITVGALDVAEEDVVLGLLLLDSWKLVALEAPSPLRLALIYDSKCSVRKSLCERIAHTDGELPSSRFAGPRSGTKLWPSEI